MADALRDAGLITEKQAADSELPPTLVALNECKTYDDVLALLQDPHHPECTLYIAKHPRWAWERYARHPRVMMPPAFEVPWRELGDEALLRLADARTTNFVAEIKRRWPLEEGQVRCIDDYAVLSNGYVTKLLDGSPTPPNGLVSTTPSSQGWLEVVRHYHEFDAAWQGPEIFEALTKLAAHKPGKAYLQPDFAVGFEMHQPKTGDAYPVIRHTLDRRYRSGISLPVQRASNDTIEHLKNLKLVLDAIAKFGKRTPTNLQVPNSALWLNLGLAKTKAGQACLREMKANETPVGAFVVIDRFVGMPVLDVGPHSERKLVDAFWIDYACNSDGDVIEARCAAFVEPDTWLYQGWEYAIGFNGKQLLKLDTAYNEVTPL